MIIPQPSSRRRIEIKRLVDVDDFGSLSDYEMAWVEDQFMQQIIDRLAESNPMVFHAIEDAALN